MDTGILNDSLQLWEDVIDVKRNKNVINDAVNVYNPDVQQSNIVYQLDYFLDPYDAKPIDAIVAWKMAKGTIRQLSTTLLNQYGIDITTSANLINNKKDIEYYKQSNHSKLQCFLYVKHGVRYDEDGFDAPAVPVPDFERYIDGLNNVVRKTQSGCSLLRGFDKYNIFSWDDVIYYKPEGEFSVNYNKIAKYKYLSDPYHPTQVDDNLEAF